jgi:hypothetical protein
MTRKWILLFVIFFSLVLAGGVVVFEVLQGKKSLLSSFGTRVEKLFPPLTPQECDELVSLARPLIKGGHFSPQDYHVFCYADIVAKKNDIRLCNQMPIERLKERKFFRKLCYVILAVQNGKPELCTLLPSSPSRIRKRCEEKATIIKRGPRACLSPRCYFLHALVAAEPVWCEAIEDPSSRNLCLALLARKESDCRKLPPNSIPRHGCFVHVAYAQNNLAFCNAEGGFDRPGAEGELTRLAIGACVSYFAVRQNNLRSCAALSSSTLRSLCEATIQGSRGRKSKQASACDSLNPPQRKFREFCEMAFTLPPKLLPYLSYYHPFIIPSPLYYTSLEW